jgi:hypothetical protein
MPDNRLMKICEEIEEEIWDTCIDPADMVSPVIDGIVDLDNYMATTPKILWILKEPYDDEENGVATGGGWHFSRDFLTKEDFYTRMGRSRVTWHPITYVTYGILNGFIGWNEMSFIRDDRSMLDVIRKIAVINVKKLPGFTRTKDSGSIALAYQMNKALLHKQIDTYNPDIIIGGSTLHLFYDELGIRQKDIRISGSIHFAINKGKLLIHAYHPAQTQVGREAYIGDIVDVAQKFWNMTGRTGRSTNLIS